MRNLNDLHPHPITRRNVSWWGDINGFCDCVGNVMITPIIAEETPTLKHGDVFTIAGDNPMVKGKTFICVPYNYESRSLRKIWAKKIQIANASANVLRSTNQTNAAVCSARD